MDLVITPSLCKEQTDAAGKITPAAFSGSVTVKLPTMPESYRFKAKYGRKSVGLDTKSDADVALASLEMIADIAEEVKPFFTKVELTEINTKKEIKTVDELYSHEPAFAIIAEIGMKFIQGFAEKN